MPKIFHTAKKMLTLMPCKGIIKMYNFNIKLKGEQLCLKTEFPPAE